MNVVSDYAGVVMPDMAGMALPTMNESEVRAMQQESFDEAVGPSRKAFQDKGFKTEEICLVGNPGDEIAAFAKNEGLDLIVMGTAVTEHSKPPSSVRPLRVLRDQRHTSVGNSGKLTPTDV